MPVPQLVDDTDVYSIPAEELRFRQACQFYLLFMRFHGPDAGLKGNRFFWMCYVDAFLMAIVSLRDLTGRKDEFNESSLLLFIVVLRNLTAHQAVVSAGTPTSMIVRDLHLQAGSYNRDRPDHEMPLLSATKIELALEAYKSELEAKNKWHLERRNIEGAAPWIESLKSRPEGKIFLSEVFAEAIRVVSELCSFQIPEGTFAK